VNDEWGNQRYREHPTGLGIVNLRTREMKIAGQTKTGSGLWHVNGSPDGRWRWATILRRNLYLIDRHTDEMNPSHYRYTNPAAADIPSDFSADSTRMRSSRRCSQRQSIDEHLRRSSPKGMAHAERIVIKHRSDENRTIGRAKPR